METLVEMKNIHKEFFGVPVLQDINFDVKAGEVIALCGENGAGKSTLMKILAAIYRQGSGTVYVEGKEIHNATPLEMQHYGISMIHQELNLLENMTVAQNIFLSREPVRKTGLIDFQRMNAESKRLLESLGETIEPTVKIRTLKIAQKQMVEIAKAISFDVKVLIMDEPTAVLTTKETEVLFSLINSLVERGIGIVYISHRLGEVKQIANRVTILRDGLLVTTRDVASVTEKEIASLMVGREISQSTVDDFKGDHSDTVLEVKGITGDILKDVSFKVSRGEILGFSGLVGAGRSELMEMIFGLRKFDKGEILLNGKPTTIKSAVAAIRAKLGFATEDRKQTGLILGRSLAENTDYVYRVKNKGVVLPSSKVKERAMKNIGKLNIICNGPSQLVKNLSGGNQQKIVLAKWLSSDPEIFIVDEPTRGIDVGARAEIYEMLKELAKEGKTIIIVSSDLTEVLTICQRIIVLHEGVVKGEFTGDERTEDNIMHHAINAN